MTEGNVGAVLAFEKERDEYGLIDAFVRKINCRGGGLSGGIFSGLFFCVAREMIESYEMVLRLVLE